MLRIFMVLALVAGLAGCAALPVPNLAGAQSGAAQTRATLDDERIAQGYVALAAARRTAARLLDAGMISIDTAQRVQTLADGVRAGLDLARAHLAAGDMAGVEQQLAGAAQGLALLGELTKGAGK